MTIESFQRFVESFCPSACVPVDLVKIARNVAMSNIGPRVEHDFRYQPAEIVPSPFCLVMDGECCLDRLYGGFFGDWVCGGQWNRMVDFLKTFFQVASSNNIEITVFLNGASEPHRLNNWVQKQESEKEKIAQVLRHVSVKGTPPPKVWWVAPSGLRSCLRILLRHLKVNVVLTTSDHHQEVMAYLKKYNYHGLLADDPEYVIFNPPRYFSSVQLKLTFKGCLETKECILNEVTRCLNLHPSRICIVAALLGNHIISDTELAPFHRSLCPDSKENITSNVLIKSVVEYVRNLPSVDNLHEVARHIFGTSNEELAEKFRQCVVYYSREDAKNKSLASGFQPSARNIFPQTEGNAIDDQISQYLHTYKHGKGPLPPTSGCADANSSSQYQENDHHSGLTNLSAICSTKSLQIKNENNAPDCLSKFASEREDSEMASLRSIRNVLECKSKHTALYQLLSNQENFGYGNGSGGFTSLGNDDSVSNHKEDSNFFSMDPLSNANLESSMEAMSLKTNDSLFKKILTKPTPNVPPLPKVSTEVMRMALERHQKGLMHPFIYQILSQGEIRIPVTFEEELARELPSAVCLYRPLRQMLYALLFNQHHLHFLAEQKKEKDGIDEKVPEIIIKEWIYVKGNKYQKPDLVPSMLLGWPVPTITRLWFGVGPEDNKKRLQAFFTCLRSNNPMMRDRNFVPQHFILLCCVLRYMITSPEMPFLHKHELDAFLVQAVDQHLADTEHTQKLELPLVTSRGVQLAALFMQGVEHALLVNDACGAPISWLMCCPWLFFDGKIFHRKLLKANSAKNLMDLCDNRFEEVSAIELMRNAIVEGTSVKFINSSIMNNTARPPLPFSNFSVPPPPGPPSGRGRGHQRVVPRGGQLEVAGVVVGSWGPNYGQGPRSPTRSIPPQVVSVGGITRGRGSSHIAGASRVPLQGRSTHVHGAKSSVTGMQNFDL